MPLTVIGDKCHLEPDRSRGTVVLQSSFGVGEFSQAFDELNALSARQYAQSVAAQNGVTAPRINGNVVGPYPVNADGEPLDEVKGPDNKPLPQTHPRMQVAFYRLDVPVASPIV